MKKISIISFVILISCNASKSITVGTFQKQGVDFFYALKLDNTDSVFVLTKKYFEVNSSCTGKWRQKGNIIFLKCDEEKEVTAVLLGGYMSQREYKVVIKSSNKLKLDNVVLKRK